MSLKSCVFFFTRSVIGSVTTGVKQPLCFSKSSWYFTWNFRNSLHENVMVSSFPFSCVPTGRPTKPKEFPTHRWDVALGLPHSPHLWGVQDVGSFALYLFPEAIRIKNLTEERPWMGTGHGSVLIMKPPDLSNRYRWKLGSSSELEGPSKTRDKQWNRLAWGWIGRAQIWRERICFDFENETFIFKGEGTQYNFERKGKKVVFWICLEW